MTKNIKYLITSVVVAIIFVFVKVYPDVILKKINSEQIAELSSNKDEKVYICRLTTYTGPEWIIVGNEKGLFESQTSEEQVIIEGDFLPFLFRNKQDDVYAKTNFIIIARTKGEKNFVDSDPTKYKVLKADKWYIYQNN